MAEQHRAPLPRGIELAWNASGRRKPGPRAGLSLTQIVQAAIGIADAEGITAVSLARVAAVLGCATTALYRHVGSKDDLVVLMRDAAVAPPHDLAPPDPGTEWQDALRQLSWRMLALYRRHPWILQLPTTGPPTTPNELLWGEYLLRAMSRTGLRPADRLRAVTLLSGYVREQGRLVTDPVIAAAPAGDTDYFQLLRSVLTPDRYPAFCRVLTDDTVTGSIRYDDEEFQFGLDRILAGLTELDRRRRH